MPRSSQTVRVQPIPGEKGCYHVESWSRPSKPHRVELFADGPREEDKGLPECDCESYVTTKRIARRAGASAYFGRAGQCRHITAVLRYELMQRLKELAQR